MVRLYIVICFVCLSFLFSCDNQTAKICISSVPKAETINGGILVVTSQNVILWWKENSFKEILRLDNSVDFIEAIDSSQFVVGLEYDNLEKGMLKANLEGEVLWDSLEFKGRFGNSVINADTLFLYSTKISMIDLKRGTAKYYNILPDMNYKKKCIGSILSSQKTIDIDDVFMYGYNEDVLTVLKEIYTNAIYSLDSNLLKIQEFGTRLILLKSSGDNSSVIVVNNKGVVNSIKCKYYISEFFANEEFVVGFNEKEFEVYSLSSFQFVIGKKDLDGVLIDVKVHGRQLFLIYKNRIDRLDIGKS